MFPCTIQPRRHPHSLLCMCGTYPISFCLLSSTAGMTQKTNGHRVSDVFINLAQLNYSWHKSLTICPHMELRLTASRKRPNRFLRTAQAHQGPGWKGECQKWWDKSVRLTALKYCHLLAGPGRTAVPAHNSRTRSLSNPPFRPGRFQVWKLWVFFIGWLKVPLCVVFEGGGDFAGVFKKFGWVFTGKGAWIYLSPNQSCNYTLCSFPEKPV